MSLKFLSALIMVVSLLTIMVIVSSCSIDGAALSSVIDSAGKAVAGLHDQ